MFSESEDESSPAKTPATSQKSTTAPKPKDKKKNLTLFDEEDENYGDNEDYGKDFAIKEQFQGTKGAKLMRLQSRFQSDSRFNMDARFLDDNYGDDGGEDGEGEDYPTNRNGHDQADENDERQWQYSILESVTGKKYNQGPSAPSKDSKKK